MVQAVYVDGIDSQSWTAQVNATSVSSVAITCALSVTVYLWNRARRQLQGVCCAGGVVCCV